MVGLRRVRRQLDVGEDRAEKQPGAEVAADQISVLALPADAGGRGKRLLHQRRGIDEHLDRRRRLRAAKRAASCFSLPLIRS